MPFVEIGKIIEDWVRVRPDSISISHSLRMKHFHYVHEHPAGNSSGFKKVRVFFDKENGLLGLQPSDKGYTFVAEKITCKILPNDIHIGLYNARWDDKEKMIIVNLNDIINKD